VVVSISLFISISVPLALVGIAVLLFAGATVEMARPSEVSKREAERVEMAQLIIRDSSGMKTARIRVSLGDDA
jgi:hypothetical protein